MPNQLAKETSPYLLQHADNPVNWYPWGEEALQRARAEDKPIFLSIGYSACHWCHVMAHESFEDEKTAAILNEHFVCIKVDREERPDLDRVYMSSVQAITGRGGWPMSVFITPDGRPFHGGTYFPPTPRYGMPSFTDVLQSVVNAWDKRRDEVIEGGHRVVAAIEQQNAIPARGGEELRSDTLEAAFEGLQSGFDAVHGGWGGGPKFPQPMALEFLLRYHYSRGTPSALQMARRTLDAMGRGGMYDQLGGGFHRYSVDDHWLVPHFEKMLYDNAQLARVYLHAWQVTGDPFYRSICEETLDYVTREMTAPNGGFYSTQDADSEGEEGKFFVWRPHEIRQVLGDKAEAFMAAYGATEGGNFEGRNILEFVADMNQRPALAEARRTLFGVREARVRPGRDEKILTSWNGLMLGALAEAARVLDRTDYQEAARRSGSFLLGEMRQENGRLLHVWAGGEAKLNGYLEDYSYLIEGLLELYQTTFDSRWYQAARELADTMIEHFATEEALRGFKSPSPSDGVEAAGFYDTSDDHEDLVVRPRELQDNATPSGSAMAVWVLIRLAGLTVQPRLEQLARASLREVQPVLRSYPLGFGQWLIALDYALAHPREIAIVGELKDQATVRLLEACTDGYRPHQVLAVKDPGVDTQIVPLLQDRGLIGGCPAAYVCADFTCHPPVTDPAALSALLG